MTHKTKHPSQQQTPREQVRTFLLDLFPLTDRLSEQNSAIADTLHRTALALYLDEEDTAKHLDQTMALLFLALELGYLDCEVAYYLDRQANKLVDALERAPSSNRKARP